MDLVANRFELVAAVASGGMGVVYRAHDRETGADVALKRLRETDAETVQRFAREAEILAGMSHPAIVRYVAHGHEGATPYLVMEWIEGETLHTRLEQGRMTLLEAVRLARRLADALVHAHQRGVIHRDLKPSNVLLRDDQLDQAVLVDFGIARATGAAKSLTETGALIGTPAYMSPEQARGDRDLSAATDIYGLGCLLYECATGQRAFDGKHALALLAKVVLWEPVAPRRLDPSFPEALEAQILRALAKAPADRPTGIELGAELARIEATIGGLDRTASSVPASKQPAEVTARIPAHHGSIVIATSAEGADGTTLEIGPATHGARDELARTIASAHGVRATVLRDGSIVVIVDRGESARASAKLAVTCARALVAALPELLVAITAGDALSPNALEQTVAGLAKEAMARLFAGVAAVQRPPRSIRIDAATERELDEPIVRVAGIGYVHG